MERGVGLIDVSDANEFLVARLKAPKECAWVSDEEWFGTRLDKTNIALLRNNHLGGRMTGVAESLEMVSQCVYSDFIERTF